MASWAWVACGAYPADPYDSDILAVPLEHYDADEAMKLIERSAYFRNTFLFGLRDGRLAVGERGKPLVEQLQPVLDQYIAQEIKQDRRFINPFSMSYVVTRPLSYKPGLVKVLVKNVEELLR